MPVGRDPTRAGRLGSAVFGALLGTAGVPFAVAVVVACGSMVDEISSAILGRNPATCRRLQADHRHHQGADHADQRWLPAHGDRARDPRAMVSLYFVMLIREVALVAFVVFAPIALASWTWSATRHWLRRWIEVVGALLFSKIAMAVIFTLGLSAIGSTDKASDSSLGTFLAGILLFAMAAFAPLATYSFIHWAGDQGQAATRAPCSKERRGRRRSRSEWNRRSAGPRPTSPVRTRQGPSRSSATNDDARRRAVHRGAADAVDRLI